MNNFSVCLERDAIVRVVMGQSSVNSPKVVQITKVKIQSLGSKAANKPAMF